MARTSAVNLSPSLLDEAAAARRRGQRQRTRLAIAFSATVTVAWALYVTVAGHWPRVGDHWVSSLTMVFGSFVAGSTPQGGGAVAFPVFTKALDIPAGLARTFSLCIQTVGMGTATVAILIRRRPIEVKAVAVGCAAATVGFAAGILGLHDLDQPYWPSRLPSAYVRVTFTIVLAALAMVLYLDSRVSPREVHRHLPRLNARRVSILAVGGVLGGLASSLTGSGADVVIFLAIFGVFAIDARVGVPTSVVVMAFVSILGFAFLGLAGGALDVGLTGDGVSSVGGRAVTEVGSELRYGTGPPADGSRYDLFGLWVAAAPVVAWGAPVGSALASRWTAQRLVRFAIGLAALETVTTLLVLEQLRTDGVLLVYTALGLVLAPVGLRWLVGHRHRLVGQARLDPLRSLGRNEVDMARPRRGRRGRRR